MHRRLARTSWLALWLFPSIARGQDAISTDRPGLTFTPWLVPPGRFQAELGAPNATLARGRGADTTAWNAPLQLRLGLTDFVELRLGGPLYSIVRDDDTDRTAEGWGDVETGAKVALCGGGGLRPRASMIGVVRLPVGEDEFTSRQAGYSLSVAADWALGDGNLLRGLAGVVRTPTGGDDALQGNFAALFGHTFDPRWSAYGEFGYLPGFHLSDDQAFAGAGAAYLVSDDLQLDLAADFGLTADSPDAMLAFGLSWRR